MMDKQKYKCLDSRCGYREGEEVMLTDDELNKLPFNVFMEKVESPPEFKGPSAEDILFSKRTEFRDMLSLSGLSLRRIELVLKHYDCFEDMKKDDAKKIADDKVTYDFLKKEYGIGHDKKKKKEE